jgi:hypothetical protein
MRIEWTEATQAEWRGLAEKHAFGKTSKREESRLNKLQVARRDYLIPNWREDLKQQKKESRKMLSIIRKIDKLVAFNKHVESINAD